MAIANQVEKVRGEIVAACHGAGRDPASVALMAVSKMHPVAALLEAYAAGQRLFGENRVQEWQSKLEATEACADLEMHLIGPLQSNKTAPAARHFHAVDTVDSLRVATRLNETSAELGRVLPVLVEVKLSPEETKQGVAPEELGALLDGIAPLGSLRLSGLMTVAPWPSDLGRADAEARPYFRRLRELLEANQANHPTLTQLSMGMSNDFAGAIAEGSTCVRIGTAIFGRRERA